MNWIIENYDQLILIITSVVTAASAIAALTPTTKDDGVISFLRRLVDLVALNVGHAKKDAVDTVE